MLKNLSLILICLVMSGCFQNNLCEMSYSEPKLRQELGITSLSETDRTNRFGVSVEVISVERTRETDTKDYCRSQVVISGRPESLTSYLLMLSKDVIYGITPDEKRTTQIGNLKYQSIKDDPRPEMSEALDTNISISSAVNFNVSKEKEENIVVTSSDKNSLAGEFLSAMDRLENKARAAHEAAYRAETINLGYESVEERNRIESAYSSFQRELNSREIDKESAVSRLKSLDRKIQERVSKVNQLIRLVPELKAKIKRYDADFPQRALLKGTDSVSLEYIEHYLRMRRILKLKFRVKNNSDDVLIGFELEGYVKASKGYSQKQTLTVDDLGLLGPSDSSVANISRRLEQFYGRNTAIAFWVSKVITENGSYDIDPYLAPPPGDELMNTLAEIKDIRLTADELLQEFKSTEIEIQSISEDIKLLQAESDKALESFPEKAKDELITRRRMLSVLKPLQ